MLKQQTKQYEVLLVPGVLWLTGLFFKINWNWKPFLWVSNTQVKPTQAHYKLYNKVTNTSVQGSTKQPMNYTEHRSTGMKRLLMPPPPLPPLLNKCSCHSMASCLEQDDSFGFGHRSLYKSCDLHWSGWPIEFCNNGTDPMHLKINWKTYCLPAHLYFTTKVLVQWLVTLRAILSIVCLFHQKHLFANPNYPYRLITV